MAMDEATPQQRRKGWLREEGIVTLENLCAELELSESTVLGLDIPHVKLARGTHYYFIDEIVTWLRARERTA